MGQIFETLCTFPLVSSYPLIYRLGRVEVHKTVHLSSIATPYIGLCDGLEVGRYSTRARAERATLEASVVRPLRTTAL